ncbi:MAG: orotidine-5'-phosphate decarboxylase [Bacteroidetes bacterium]|nr:orotidine-5'-phosphate decarboxylase [Bacteroidota bacterium]
MTRSELFGQIQKKQSYLCVGLDTDISKIPSHLLKSDDPVFEFNRQIIDATKEFTVAYKPNLAFYESLGWKGLQSLAKTVDYIPKDIFTIADAKRGDIGNTASMYAKTFFELYGFDAVTVAPYMGSDSVKPFLEYKNKWTILLALTSNAGANDFQLLVHSPQTGVNRKLFEEVIIRSQPWGTTDNLMYVVGATQAEMLSDIRKMIPEHFLLVPGVGAQGGSLHDVSKYGMNKECGLLVNSSRQIIYASPGEDFAEKANAEAKRIQEEMSRYLSEFAK